jgi:peptidoglycan/xylan/chitin deacetylase (PgdA/CDA1 family)
VRLDRLATLYVARPLAVGGWRQRAGQSLPVLMYHSVSDDLETVPAYYRTVTAPGVFRRQMTWLRENGWRGVSLQEGWEAIEKGRAERLVAITFDDGFEDFYTNAVPALEKNGFTATMYLPTAFIGMERKIFGTRRCMTWEEVNDARGKGIEFGSHTVNHPKLVELSWEKIRAELVDSKREIENRMGRGISSFAYPYAFPQARRDFGPRFREVLQEAGYGNCVTTVVGRVFAGDDPFFLKRLPANSCDDADLLGAKLEGAYDWVAWPQSAFKSVKKVLRG